MALQFIFGNPGSGKSHYLYEHIIRESMKHPDINYIILVPEQFTMQTQKELVLRHPRHGIMNIDVLSFARLAFRVLEETGNGSREILDDEGKNLILRRLAGKKEDSLKVLKGNIKKPGYISEVKSVISELTQYNISPDGMDDMITEADESSYLAWKLKDIQVMYQAFEEYLADKYITKEEILDILCNVMDKSRMLKDSVIALDGFTGFTPLQNKVLGEMLHHCQKVMITVTMDKREDPYVMKDKYQLFALSKQMVTSLVKIAGEEKVLVEEPVCLYQEPVWRFRNAPALAFLEKELFRYSGRTYREKQSNVRVYAAANPRMEVECAAQRIRFLIRKKEYRYREIAVITGDLETYSREILRQFEKNQIPCFIDYKKNILSNPMVELIRAALEVLQSGFSYESVFRFLKTGLVMPLAGLSPEVIYQAENYVIALGIRGFKRWNSTWERVCRGAELINLDELNQFREAVVTPFLPLREVFSNRKATVRERTEALVHFLEALEMEQKLAAMAQQFEEVGDMSLAKEYGQEYGLVMDLFDRIVALLGEEIMGQREYAEILDAGFAEIKVGLIPAVVDRIVVGDITRTRLSNIKVLFFAGVNDGIVPSVSGRGGILSEADRRALREMQVELAPTAREESFLQRFYLYLALTKPSDYLYLSCAASSAEGKAMRPSSLMLQLLKLFPEKRLEQPKEEKEALWSPELGMSWVLRGLQDEKSGENDQFISLYRYFIQAESYRDEMQALSDAAFYTYQDTGIGKAAARALYSPILRGSVTRMELYASCAYAHFLSYGLELSERQMYEIAPSDIGNLFHAAIDMYFTRMKEENRRFSGISEEDRQKMVAECVASVTEEYGNAILGSSYRNQYLERKVYRITDRTIWALTEQLKKGDFEPAGFEVSFSPMDHLRAMRIPLSSEEAIHLRGRIDRIDLCEDGDRLYLKIIDYKTGKTKFDLTDIYYGLQLQLVVYMYAAMEKIGREYPDKTVVPAGLFYYHIEDPMVERKPVESEEETNADILKALRMNGLVNGDREALAHLDNRLGEEATADSDVVPVSIKNEAIVERRSQAAGEEKFRVLGAYVNRKMKHMGREILDGNIAASPYKNGQKTACDYCPYHSVCGFDLKTDGYQFRRFDKLSPEEIWGKMEEKDKETER
mgnify:CR=1 FL=1